MNELKYDYDEMIELAFVSWHGGYTLLHPAMKLAGEAGEILDLVAKDMFKPNFSMWNCTVCNYGKDFHQKKSEIYLNKPYIYYGEGKNHFCFTKVYTPLIVDELGDWWYYCRILASINNIELVAKEIKIDPNNSLSYINELNIHSAKLLGHYLATDEINSNDLGVCFNWFMSTIKSLNLTLDHITHMNYLKLNSDPTNHGWKE